MIKFTDEQKNFCNHAIEEFSEIGLIADDKDRESNTQEFWAHLVDVFEHDELSLEELKYIYEAAGLDGFVTPSISSSGGLDSSHSDSDNKNKIEAQEKDDVNELDNKNFTKQEGEVKMENNNMNDWNSLAAQAVTEGAKDGTAAAAAEIITDAVVKTLTGFVPLLSLVNANEYGRSLLLVATPWAIGAATHMFPDLVPGDPSQIRSICYRAIRGSATIRFAPLVARLKAPLAEAFDTVKSMDKAE